MIADQKALKDNLCRVVLPSLGEGSCGLYARLRVLQTAAASHPTIRELSSGDSALGGNGRFRRRRLEG